MITREELTEMEKLWGKQRVLDTVVFLERQKDQRGILCPVEVTAVKIETVLYAVVDGL